MINPYPVLPLDKRNVPMQNVPPTASTVGITMLEQGTISSVIGLTADTTFIEIMATGQPAAMRWVSSAVGLAAASSVLSGVANANFDHTIATGTWRQFAVPIDAYAYPPISSQVGANIRNALYRNVAVKSMAAGGSVLVMQY